MLFLDADDELEGDVLAAGVRRAREAEADLVFMPMERRLDGRQTELRDGIREPVDPAALFEAWLRRTQVNPSATLWRRGFLEEIGGWDETVLINQDAEIVMRALLRGPRLAVNREGRGIYNMTGASSLSGAKSREKLENYVETLTRLAAAADQAAPSFAGRTGGIEETLYGVARMAFRAGWSETGNRALAALRNRGVTRHFGSPVHVLASRLMGLETKVRLWGR